MRLSNELFEAQYSDEYSQNRVSLSEILLIQLHFFFTQIVIVLPDILKIMNIFNRSLLALPWNQIHCPTLGTLNCIALP